MNAFIVDDEPMARDTIVGIIKENLPELMVVGEAGSVKAAVTGIKQTKPDVVFLDIDLPDGTGFDIVNALRPVNFRIIFTTAHEKYAIKAIKFSALDYILKPVSEIELMAAVNKLKHETDARHQEIKLDAFYNNLNNTQKNTGKLVLKTSESIHLVEIKDIIHCESDNNYTSFFLNNGRKILVSKGLKEYTDLLEEFGFFRVHQSHLVNLNYIERFDKKSGGYLVLGNKSQIPVSQRKKQALLDLFEQYR